MPFLISSSKLNSCSVRNALILEIASFFQIPPSASTILKAGTSLSPIRNTNLLAGCPTSWNVRKGINSTGLGTITSAFVAIPVFMVATWEQPSSEYSCPFLFSILPTAFNTNSSSSFFWKLACSSIIMRSWSYHWSKRNSDVSALTSNRTSL